MRRQPQHYSWLGRTDPPKLASGMDMFGSRPLREVEREGLICMLLPGNHEIERIAAARVVARLGIIEAKPLIEGIIKSELTLKPIPAFIFAIRELEESEARMDLPLAHEQLALLIGMRNSDDVRDRRHAELVLQGADIKYGSPLPIPNHWNPEPEDAVLDHRRHRSKWPGLTKLVPAPGAAKTGSGGSD